MKNGTKKLIKAAAVSGLVLATGAAVFAHGGPGYGSGMKWGGGQHGMMGGHGGMHGMGGPGFMGRGDPVAYADQHLDELKTGLGITADQEGAWEAYAEAVRGKAQLMTAHRQTMHGAGGPANTEQRIAMMQQGAEQMQRLATATADFYATLTPEQKAKADELVGHQFGHGPRFGGGRRAAK